MGVAWCLSTLPLNILWSYHLVSSRSAWLRNVVGCVLQDVKTRSRKLTTLVDSFQDAYAAEVGAIQSCLLYTSPSPRD